MKVIRRQRGSRGPCRHRVRGTAAEIVLHALGIGWLTGMAIPMQADVCIDVPEIGLLPNTPSQRFDVHLWNGGEPIPVIGIGFNIQVADGGPLLGGKTNGPAITSVDIFTGTVFASNNNGLSGSGSIAPQLYERGTLTRSNTVSLPAGLSKVATVVLDTTGFSAGTYSLTLSTRNGRTKYPSLDDDVFPALLDGSVTLGSAPSFTAIAAQKASRVSLSFSTTGGFTYRAQRAPGLTTGDWISVSHALTIDGPLMLDVRKGTGATETIFVESPSGATAFYRLIMERGEP